MNHTSMPLLVSLSRQFERLEPLKEKKNPLVAFMIGFAFGPLAQESIWPRGAISFSPLQC